jgi:hypothetical protein
MERGLKLIVGNKAFKFIFSVLPGVSVEIAFWNYTEKFIKNNLDMFSNNDLDS